MEAPCSAVSNNMALILVLVSSEMTRRISRGSVLVTVPPSWRVSSTI